MNLELIEHLIDSNLIAFVVMVAIIWFVCTKLHVGRIFENQRKKIKTVVDSSEQEKQTSQRDLDDIKQELEVLPQRVEQLELEAKNTAKVLSENIVKDTENKVQILKNNADTTLDFHIKDVKEKLSSEVSSVAINLAKNNIEKVLQDNPDIHYKILRECINEL